MTANILTLFRIAAGIALLFTPVFSSIFYVLYLSAGISDMLDGYTARKTNTASPFGAKLDTIADLIFAAACMIRLLPVLIIPSWLYYWISVIAFIKIINIISGFIVQKRFITIHSFMNKLTGFLLFLFPLTTPYIPVEYSGGIVCASAVFAAIQEGHIIRTGKGSTDEYNA